MYILSWRVLIKKTAVLTLNKSCGNFSVIQYYKRLPFNVLLLVQNSRYRRFHVVTS